MDFDDLLPKSPQPPKDVVYIYADGSANLYFITEKLIEYSPMTPERSSSGMYSGGKPAKVTLNKKAFFKIQRAIEDAAINIDEHIPNRVKMSGNIHFIKEDKSYNLAPDSNSKKELEKTFKTLLGIV